MLGNRLSPSYSWVFPRGDPAVTERGYIVTAKTPVGDNPVVEFLRM